MKSLKVKNSIIDVSSIIMIQSNSNYSFIHLDNGKVMFTSKTLKYWCGLLKLPFMVRVHHSYCINKTKIQHISNKTIVMVNGTTAKVSRNFNMKKFIVEL